MATAPPTAHKIVARRYKDVLTPVLHTKFNSASLFILLVCYATAVLIGDWGCRSAQRCGQALLLTFDLRLLGMVSFRLGGHSHAHALRIELVNIHPTNGRLAQYDCIRDTTHNFADSLAVGARTSASSFQMLYKRILNRVTIFTFLCYAFSAWWFSEVYIWSKAADANLGWIDPGKSVYLRQGGNVRAEC